MLAKARAATAWPWPDRLAAIAAENAFRHDRGVLPSEEAEALRADYDRELDRLYALAEAADGDA